MNKPAWLRPVVIAWAAACAAVAIAATVVVSGRVGYEPFVSRRFLTGLCQFLFTVVGIILLFLRQVYRRMRHGRSEHDDWLISHDDQSPFWAGVMYFSVITGISGAIHLFFP
jgi:hypothetical protein